MPAKLPPMLRAAHVLVWILFFGIAFVAGALLVNYGISVFFMPERAATLGTGLRPYQALDLSDLMARAPLHYHVLMALLILATTAKALVFYFLIELPYGLNMAEPFTRIAYRRVLNISITSFAIGCLLVTGTKLAAHLTAQGLVLIGTEEHSGGGGEFLMMAGILFFITQIFKRGIELQTENDLTI